MSEAPSLKDLPRVAGDLKSELETFNTTCMKKADTQEKNILPSAEDVIAEKTQKTLIAGIEKFDATKLKHTETQEKNPLPDKDVVQAEKVHQNLLNGVEHFDKSTMKHATTQEKICLPDSEVREKLKLMSVYESGKTYDEVCVDVSLNQSSLYLRLAMRQFPFPNSKIVQAEKVHQNLLNGVEHFDKSTMKHTTTEEKNSLPDTQVIAQEKDQLKLIENGK